MQKYTLHVQNNARRKKHIYNKISYVNDNDVQ